MATYAGMLRPTFCCPNNDITCISVNAHLKHVHFINPSKPSHSPLVRLSDSQESNTGGCTGLTSASRWEVQEKIFIAIVKRIGWALHSVLLTDSAEDLDRPRYTHVYLRFKDLPLHSQRP